MTELATLTRAVEELHHVVLGKRLSADEVAARIRRDKATIRRWVAQKRFPAPVGGYWLLADVVRWERGE